MRGRIFITIIIVSIVLSATHAYAKENKEEIKEPAGLYAVSAALIDGESGRVLFSKNKEKVLPMASTTKIMTCIVALENGNLDDKVTISKNAAQMPDVQLNANSGEEYRLEDLLYSLMLESHNDSAYAIAEHIGGSVEGFAKMMNEKAKSIGCKNTYFITPNGLDAKDEKGTHSTTAIELSLIMRYCINISPKKEEFLEITRKSSYSFSDLSGKRNFTCNNHNAFLNMMEGALSGKTGFTSQAGYCYVGALERDNKTYIIALLACGWPNNKTYKWSDARKLMNYGMDNYVNYSLEDTETTGKELQPLEVINGKTDHISEKAYTNLKITENKNSDTNQILKRSDEEVKVSYVTKTILNAPIKKGTVVGNVKYTINEELLKTENIITCSNIEKIDLKWCISKVIDLFII